MLNPREIEETPRHSDAPRTPVARRTSVFQPVEQNGFQPSASGPTQQGCHQAFCPLQAFKYHESDDSRKHGASRCHRRTALTVRGCDQTTPEIVFLPSKASCCVLSVSCFSLVLCHTDPTAFVFEAKAGCASQAREKATKLHYHDAPERGVDKGECHWHRNSFSLLTGNTAGPSGLLRETSMLHWQCDWPKKNSSQATPTHLSWETPLPLHADEAAPSTGVVVRSKNLAPAQGITGGGKQFEFAVGPLESLWYLITALILHIEKKTRKFYLLYEIQISSPNKESHLQPSSIMVEFLPLNPGNVQIWKNYHRHVGLP